MCGNNGDVIIYSIKEEVAVRTTHTEELPVEDAQWNPAENYLITCYKDGTIKLFDGDKGTETLSFERQGAGKLFVAICRCQILVLDAQHVRRLY